MGVFLTTETIRYQETRLPHVRGGVSEDAARKAAEAKVFPTCVGVFPCVGGEVGRNNRLPHVRGGVSQFKELEKKLKDVFPTCVGVFL